MISVCEFLEIILIVSGIFGRTEVPCAQWILMIRFPFSPLCKNPFVSLSAFFCKYFFLVFDILLDLSAPFSIYFFVFDILLSYPFSFVYSLSLYIVFLSVAIRVADTYFGPCTCALLASALECKWIFCFQ